jgi:hypothetical protein
VNINIDNFKSIIKKATLNNTMTSVQLVFKDGRIETSMINDGRIAIAILDVDNDVLLGTNEEIEFNFSEPSLNVLPYLNIFDEEEVDVNVSNSKIVIKNGRQKSNLHFCEPMIVSTFGSRSAGETEYFLTLDIDDNFMESFNKIKKIGNRFKKLYFNVSDGMFSIETTDKTNSYSNGLKFDLTSIEKNDLTICFDFKNFSNLMAVISDRAEDFKIMFAYVEDQEAGMLNVSSNDGSEKYYLMSGDM